MTRRTPSRAITTAGLVAVVALSLAGCSQASGSPSASAGSTSGGASASAAPIGERVDVPCSTLVPASALAVYGRAFTLESGARPRSGSPAATIVAQRGEACVWRDPSGVTITLAVARLPAAALTRLKDSLYQSSRSVPTYTVEGYFDVAHGLGRADSFPDPYWVDAESTSFGEPGDAQPVLDAARAALAAADGASATPSPDSSASVAPAP